MHGSMLCVALSWGESMLNETLKKRGVSESLLVEAMRDAAA